MTEVPPPPGAPGTLWGRRGSPLDALVRGWFTALARGGLAFVVMASLGQAAALTVYLARDARGSVGTFAKLGWFYFGWFHRVSVSAHASVLVPRDTPGVGELASGSASFDFGVALMVGTFLAIWLLYGAGRAVADQAGGGGAARVLHGLKVAPVYAVPSWLISLVVSIDVGLPADLFRAGSIEIRPSAAESLLLPLLIAAAAGAAGGARSGRYELLAREPWGRRLAGALAGGFRMFLLGLVLSFVGLLVLAVIRPDATKAYFDAVTEPPPDGTTVIIANHVLLLPNQSMWVLVPAMGGCDGLYRGGESSTFLCYGKYPTAVSDNFDFTSLEAILLTSVNVVLPFESRVRTEFGTAPSGYFLFLLVPALSVLLGGRHAAMRRARTRTEAPMVGAGAGVVFAVLVALGAWLASITVDASVVAGGISAGGAFRVGPDVAVGSVLALVWGVVGGLIGGWWVGRDLPALTTLAGPSPEAETSHPAEDG
ncbi:MAG: cell division protein PerM [Actinomycetota bacterium]